MKPLRIQSLTELKAWNINPTKDLPILFEWFFDWFFNKVVEPKKQKKAIDAYEESIKFCMICEDFNKEQAEFRMHRNYRYYANYGSTRWPKKLNKLIPKIYL